MWTRTAPRWSTTPIICAILNSARASLMRDVAYTYREIEESGYIYPIIKIDIDYYRPLYYDEAMYIHTRPSTLERVRLAVRLCHHPRGNRTTSSARGLPATVPSTPPALRLKWTKRRSTYGKSFPNRSAGAFSPGDSRPGLTCRIIGSREDRSCRPSKPWKHSPGPRNAFLPGAG